MNHSFTPSQLDAAKCARCHYNVLAHTNQANCEVCNAIGEMNIAYGMLLCESCREKEAELQKQHQAEVKNREIAYEKTMAERLKEVKLQDETIELRTDIFNAKIASIQEIKAIVDQNGHLTEEQKAFELASILRQRFEYLTEVIFRKKQELTEAGNEQRAIQVELNLLANKLRAEEREKLKIQDINYQPKPPKLVKQRAPKTAKFDKTALKRVASELAQYGITEFNIQSVVVSRKVTPEEAGRILKEMLGV